MSSADSAQAELFLCLWDQFASDRIKRCMQSCWGQQCSSRPWNEELTSVLHHHRGRAAMTVLSIRGNIPWSSQAMIIQNRLSVLCKKEENLAAKIWEYFWEYFIKEGSFRKVKRTKKTFLKECWMTPRVSDMQFSCRCTAWSFNCLFGEVLEAAWECSHNPAIWHTWLLQIWEQLAKSDMVNGSVSTGFWTAFRQEI